jgi:fumarate reductase flavoprotein subunit
MSNEAPETLTADVVVVGGGGSGLSAAIEAATLGRRVILLEKNSAPGGSTAWSVGSVSATSTPHQIAKGIKDNPDDHFEDLGLFAGKLERRDNPVLRRLLVDHAPDTFRWLIDLGVEFYGPMPEPPNRRPRMHNVLPHSRSFIHHLSRRARRLGVDIKTGCEARSLIVADGRVCGVEGQQGGRRISVLARGGVVLATGDFGGSPELKREFISDSAAMVDAVNVTNTGDGHRMARALGARIVNGDLAHGPEVRFIPPRRSLIHAIPPIRAIGRLVRWLMEHAPAALLRPFLMSFLTTTLAPSRRLFENGAVLVNARGERVSGDPASFGHALPHHPGMTGFIIFDADAAERFRSWPNFISTAPGVAYAYLEDYRRSRPDIFHTAAALSQLAARLGMVETALADALGHRGRGPFVALGPVRSYIIFTDGGLAVDERLRVLDAQDRPIPGLFAAGAAGQGGVLLEGHGHHLIWAFTSGRIAGRSAAQAAVTAVDVPTSQPHTVGSGNVSATTGTTMIDARSVAQGR